MIRPLSLATIAFALPLIAGGPIQGPPAQHRTDWLVATIAEPARVVRHDARHEIELTNGLIRRTWRLAPNAATVAFDNLMTGAVLAARRQARGASSSSTASATTWAACVGQPDYAYLRPEWLDAMTADPAAFQCRRLRDRQTDRALPVEARCAAPANRPWPPPGVVADAALRAAERRRSHGLARLGPLRDVRRHSAAGEVARRSATARPGGRR